MSSFRGGFGDGWEEALVCMGQEIIGLDCRQSNTLMSACYLRKLLKRRHLDKLADFAGNSDDGAGHGL